ncbi:MAG: thioredoxin domain-containing protein [Deltaproteobacteria bacterium]|nr:thioredoxin domain-containing protein [Deltaproteobacteria bacterium]
MNLLQNEKSPYLLQHKDNPVNWYSWGEAAFQAAKEQNKPIFLSIGYSTCHWCHVMAHESFENEQVAQVMNRYFINIKIDREERPDIDEIYMAAVHAMGQRGGWPLSIFLTPDLKPFYGGTYWPRVQFIGLLEKIAEIWRTDQANLQKSGEELLAHIRAQKDPDLTRVEMDEEIFKKFTEHSLATFDSKWGGFGSAPKFPQATQLSLLLRLYHQNKAPLLLHAVTYTLEKMARGGMYDHLGGGFARYSTDEKWLIPHFEKMLYDNALLAKTYLEACQVLADPSLCPSPPRGEGNLREMFASVAKEILDYVLRDLQHPEGGFFSAEDADSEGEEGKFYAWSYSELKQVLSEDEFQLFQKMYGVTESGNFEHSSNVLWPQDQFTWKDKENLFAKSAQEKLFAVREKRIRPHRDEKILTSWNGLMLSAFALGFRILGDQKYLSALKGTINFIFEKSGLFQEGKLFARYAQNEVKYAGYLDDYAFLIQGLLDFQEASPNPQILQRVVELQQKQKELFWDVTKGAFFFSDGLDESVLLRSKDCMDTALPSGNAVSAFNLLRLYHLTGDASFKEDALTIFSHFSKLISAYPHACSQMLIAYDFLLKAKQELVIMSASAEMEKMIQKISQVFHPHLTLTGSEKESNFPPLLKGRRIQNNQVTFYLCENQSCQLPENDLKIVLDKIG